MYNNSQRESRGSDPVLYWSRPPRGGGGDHGHHREQRETNTSTVGRPKSRHQGTLITLAPTFSPHLIWIFGSNGNSGVLPFLDTFNLESKQWISSHLPSSSLINSTFGHCSTVVFTSTSATVWLFGGCSESTQNMDGNADFINTLYAWSFTDPDRVDEELASMRSFRKVIPTGLASLAPSPRIGASMVHYKAKLYIFGGLALDAKVKDQVYCFDTQTLEWSGALTCKGTIPDAREGHTATIIGSRMYICGGFTPNNPNNPTSSVRKLSDISYLDLETLTWHAPKTSGFIFMGRGLHSAVGYKESIYVFGGWKDNRQGEQGHSFDTFRFDTVSNTWTLLEGPLPNAKSISPTSRAGHGAAVVGNVMYVAGGARGLGKEIVLDDMYWASIAPPSPPTSLRFSLKGMKPGTLRIEWTPSPSTPKGQVYSLCILDEHRMGHTTEEDWNELYRGDRATFTFDFQKPALERREMLAVRIKSASHPNDHPSMWSSGIVARVGCSRKLKQLFSEPAYIFARQEGREVVVESTMFPALVEARVAVDGEGVSEFKSLGSISGNRFRAPLPTVGEYNMVQVRITSKNNGNAVVCGEWVGVDQSLVIGEKEGGVIQNTEISTESGEIVVSPVPSKPTSPKKEAPKEEEEEEEEEEELLEGGSSAPVGKRVEVESSSVEQSATTDTANFSVQERVLASDSMDVDEVEESVITEGVSETVIQSKPTVVQDESVQESVQESGDVERPGIPEEPGQEDIQTPAESTAPADEVVDTPAADSSVLDSVEIAKDDSAQLEDSAQDLVDSVAEDVREDEPEPNVVAFIKDPSPSLTEQVPPPEEEVAEEIPYSPRLNMRASPLRSSQSPIRPPFSPIVPISPRKAEKTSTASEPVPSSDAPAVPAYRDPKKKMLRQFEKVEATKSSNHSTASSTVSSTMEAPVQFVGPTRKRADQFSRSQSVDEAFVGGEVEIAPFTPTIEGENPEMVDDDEGSDFEGSDFEGSVASVSNAKKKGTPKKPGPKKGAKGKGAGKRKKESPSVTTTKRQKKDAPPPDVLPIVAFNEPENVPELPDRSFLGNKEKPWYYSLSFGCKVEIRPYVNDDTYLAKPLYYVPTERNTWALEVALDGWKKDKYRTIDLEDEEQLKMLVQYEDKVRPPEEWTTMPKLKAQANKLTAAQKNTLEFHTIYARYPGPTK